MTTREQKKQVDFVQGTMDLLILQTLAPGRAHGHAIARSIERRSEEVLQVGHGSLYPALQRLMQTGLITAEDGVSENKRQARFYRLTAKAESSCTRRPRNGRDFHGPWRACFLPWRKKNHNRE